MLAMAEIVGVLSLTRFKIPKRWNHASLLNITRKYPQHNANSPNTGTSGSQSDSPMPKQAQMGSSFLLTDMWLYMPPSLSLCILSPLCDPQDYTFVAARITL